MAAWGGVRGSVAAGSAVRAAQRSVVAFLAVKVLVLAVNVWWFPTLRAAGGASATGGAAAAAVEAWVPVEAEPPGREPAPRTALLIPMRNETATLPRTLPGLLAAGFDEVIFLDDESTDGSAATVRAALSRRPEQAPRVAVVTGRPHPPGWVGKTWACAQLAELSTAEVMAFCDCDVELAPGTAAALTAELSRQSAAVLSIFCRQRTGSWPERLLTPLITDVVLCFLPFGLLRAPVPAAATASGALLVFRRSAYGRLGGFEAVRGELVEDLAIARRTRRAGERLGLALGGDLAQVRMYGNYRELIQGFGRSLGPAVGGRRSLVVAGLLWHLAAYTAPVLLLRRSGWWRLAAALGVGERLLVEAKTGGRDWLAAALVSCSPLAAAPVVAQAMRRTQHWKGRVYR